MIGRKGFVCPRRRESVLGMNFRGDAPDGWRRDRGHRSCSYCGSVQPEQFLQAIRDGMEIGPTDKNYKAYLDGMGGKFYFQHFSDAQRDEFVDLLNTKSINIGYPGRFYVLPFFVVPVGKGGST